VAELNGLKCSACSAPLTGKQRKYCADPDCTKERLYWAWVLKTYNLTPEMYWKIWKAQKGRCPITGRELVFLPGKRPHIDHDHVEGHVRGIVTAYANTRLIGRLRNYQTAQNLADYLREPPAEKALGQRVLAPGRPKKTRKKRRGKTS